MSFSGFGRVGERFRAPSRRALAFVLALSIPVVFAEITARSEVLRSAPFALQFVGMAIVATFGGFAPAILFVLVALAANRYALGAPAAQSSGIYILRVSIMIVSAGAISLMTRGLRRSAAALKIAVAKLQEQAAALMESQQASKCASWTYDSRDRTRWYPGGYEVFGIPFAELEKLPSPIALILPEDQAAVVQAVKHMISSRGPLLVEYRVMWPNGEIHWNEARGNPHETDPHLWRGVTFDITERKLAELALIRSEKLAAMGRLASTIAHEINNPLEAVTNLLYLARKDTRLGPDTDGHLAVAERELARVGEITRLALGFIRTSAERRDIELVDGIEDVLALFRHRFEMKNIQVQRSYEPGVTINIAPQELRQIATNLISNALDAASPPNARVSVRVGREEDRAVLLIEDNGSGIAEQHLARIFEPFFTTKDGTGTGIGLWVTRELVEKSGGRISVLSGDLAGGARTSFRIDFPVSLDSSTEMGKDSARVAVS